MIRVKATREGQIGNLTAIGFRVLDLKHPYQLANWFVALPSRWALRRIVFVSNCANGRCCMAPVGDLGPWNTHDDQYVMHGARPAAESGTDEQGRRTNGAGIDLSEAVWSYLRMTDNGDVEWEFITGPPAKG
jgi:hypothetical protein